MHTINKGLLHIVFVLLISQAFAQDNVVFNRECKLWVDSVYNSLTLEEQVGQLIFARANYPNKAYFSSIDTLITKYNIGGVVFFKGEPLLQVMQTNHWNKKAKTPLFISIDAEWGLAMRLSNTVRYPLQMTLGAVQNNQLIYSMGKQIGEQCRRMGIHMNFAPVVDVNSNPNNPVIGMRSFGQSPKLVANKGIMYMKGLQNSGVIACAKHFPGHGNTKADSHYELPVIHDSKETIINVDLYPFQQLINAGVNSVMIAHLSIPSLDNTLNLPSTLSKVIVSDYLKDTLGFNGLIITDGLDMKGVTKNFPEGEVALRALQAGNDILLIPDNIPLSIQNIVKAVKLGFVSRERIEYSCKKVLTYKYHTGASDYKPIETDNLIEDLNKPLYHKTSELLTKSSITVLKNESNLLPLSKANRELKKAVLVLGDSKPVPFTTELLKHEEIDLYYLSHSTKRRFVKRMISKLKNYELVIVSVLNTNISASRNFGISDTDVDIVNELSNKTNVILDIFASPYALNLFNLESTKGVIISYHENNVAQTKSAELIYNGSNQFGKLSVDAGGYDAGYGIRLNAPVLHNADPVALGVDLSKLALIDSILNSCISDSVFPGCQVLAAKDGAVFYNKSFGYHTYEKKNEVKWNSIYDLASLTKILSTTLSVMKMYEDSIIDINEKLSEYLLFLKKSDKRNLRFMPVLAHQSGLQNWIPFYSSTITDKGWDSTIYQSAISEEYPVRVANNMYIRDGYDNIIFDSIINSPFQDSTYHYSGLGFYLFKRMVENINNVNFDDYVYDNFFNKLNINNLRYNPRKYFDMENIVPTEHDTVFRKQLLHGDVHDQGAAMLGGVSGNAGLFGNTYSVAVVMQMLLNGGEYAGNKFFNNETISFFNTSHFAADSNRRGLGFDKPLLEYKEHMTNCKDASPSSFGHSGFTGTYAWADPENGLVYVFLSNRVHPDMSNTKLMDLDIRTNIHQLFYEALKP